MAKNGGYRPGSGRKPVDNPIKAHPAVVLHIDAAWLALIECPRTKYIREALRLRLVSDGLLADQTVNIFGGDQ